ncbi:TetR family transcriptional regulator [Defluviimonas sp. 20V17]|uniref:TetR family transcriptional regulator n=1 Tax=Allgaiera indica TaxID=765699 RepID=A0AAN4ZZ91_9RHOB|nr:TetR/AcrR family transcriptional regulator [Allgaiera indica]KDB02725.1 TetR family transcriptional regulator [Defluviimonas sp. 20V17]GHE01730.1 TetR family transcriptional regulator [Allgaiera indica]SDW94305.1 transcriptional regulator, TetR family [Allgaiera indica]
MARGLAHDHDEKRAAIRKGAAAYFAAHGYDRASMAGAAAACGVSKALIYHYHDSKEALLYDILEAHLSDLVRVVDAALAETSDLAPDLRLRALIQAILAAYRDADAEHKLQIDALATLPEARRTPLVMLQRRLVDALSGVLAEAAPGLDHAPNLRPVTMSVFGMLNWFYIWHRPGHGMSRSDYGDLVTDMVLGGIAAVSAPPQAPSRNRPA